MLRAHVQESTSAVHRFMQGLTLVYYKYSDTETLLVISDKCILMNVINNVISI